MTDKPISVSERKTEANKNHFIMAIPSPKFIAVQKSSICRGASSLKTTIYGGQKVRFQNWRRYC